MGKKRDSDTLFELITQQKAREAENLATPTWMDERDKAAAESPPEQAEAEAPTEEVAEAVEEESPAEAVVEEAAPAVVAEPEPEPEPAAEVEEEPEPAEEAPPSFDETPEPPLVATGVQPAPTPSVRNVEPSLPRIIKIVAVAVLLLVAFLAGRWSVTSPSGPAEEPTGVEANTGGQLQPPGEQANQTDGSPARTIGKEYLAIGYSESDTDADHLAAVAVRNFFEEQGHRAEVIPWRTSEGKTYFAVWLMKPFDSRTSSAAKQYELDITELCVRYTQTRDASQPGGASLVLRPWFVRATEDNCKLR